MWEFEDELTPAEKREALAYFTPGKLTGSLIAMRKKDSAGTPTPYEKPRSKTHARKEEPILTPGEFAIGLGLAGAAYFAGRWWGRHRKHPTAVKGDQYVLGAMVLAS